MKHSKCPSCSSSSLKDFFTIKNAPVQSLVTIKSYEEAMAIPRNDITLTFCNECGFIFNSTFDTSVDYYTKGYEDQQGFSPTFKVFITEVTNRFIDKYEVREKDVIEIGCGKGDFINLICELGNNRGLVLILHMKKGVRRHNPMSGLLKSFILPTMATWKLM